MTTHVRNPIDQYPVTAYDLLAIVVAVVAPFSFRIHISVLMATAFAIVVLVGSKHLSRTPDPGVKEGAP